MDPKTRPLKAVIAASMLAGALALGGCSSTGIGATVGGVVGAETVGGVGGTLGGAAVGGVIGHQVGKHRGE